MFGMQIPAFMLKQFYQAGSLANAEQGFQFALTNPMVPATIVEILEVSVGGTPYALESLTFAQDGITREALSVSEAMPVTFKKGAVVAVTARGQILAPGTHALTVKVRTDEFGPLKVEVEDHIPVTP
jgi:hypothetical protein